MRSTSIAANLFWIALIATIAVQSRSLGAADPPPDTTVSSDSSSTNKPLQSAIDGAPGNRTTPYVIQILPGTYKGHLVIPKDKPFLTFLGSDPAKTIITDDKNVFS